MADWTLGDGMTLGAGMTLGDVIRKRYSVKLLFGKFSSALRDGSYAIALLDTKYAAEQRRQAQTLRI